MAVNSIRHLILTCLLGSMTIGGEATSSLFCPTGFERINASCYFISEQRAWCENANEACQTVGAQLVSINTAEENEALVELLGSYGPTARVNFWIGTVLENALQFVWEDGTPLNFSFWTSNSHNERADCIRVLNSDNYHWHDDTCDIVHNVLCEAEKVGPDCPADQREFESSCYLFFSDDVMKSRDDARTLCQQNGSDHLVTIGSEGEWNFTISLIQEAGYSRTWLGLTQKSFKDLRWRDGSAVNYTNYGVDPFSRGTSMFVLDWTESYAWRDEHFSSSQNFICEIEAIDATKKLSRLFRAARKDKAPVESLVEPGTTPNYLRCGSRCFNHEDCSAFAYNDTGHSCILSATPTLVKDAPGFEYYTIMSKLIKAKKMYVTDDILGKAWSVDLDTMTFTELTVHVAKPYKVLFDYKYNFVYTADLNNSTLRRCRPDGSSDRLMNRESYEGLSDISVDLRFRRLFAVYRDSGAIVYYNLNYGLNPVEFVQGLTNPLAVQTVSHRGHLYFSHTDTIERIDVDGNNRTMIATGIGFGQPTSLTVDDDSGKIFFISTGHDNIISMNLDGTDLNLNFLPGSSVSIMPIGLAYHSGVIFWTEENSPGIHMTKSTPGSTISSEGGSILPNAKLISIV